MPDSGLRLSLFERLRREFLFGFAALSTNDAWAVGLYQNSTGVLTLTEHWDGTSWRQVASPNR